MIKVEFRIKDKDYHGEAEVKDWGALNRIRGGDYISIPVRVEDKIYIVPKEFVVKIKEGWD